MKSTNEVVNAVVDGTECTEEELRYAVRNLSIWQNQTVFAIARGANENPITEKTRRDLKHAYENAVSGNKVPLDVRLKGGSYEPGVPKEVRLQRFAKHTSETVAKLADALTNQNQTGGMNHGR